jgi:molybdopterin converting factor subunit 1
MNVAVKRFAAARELANQSEIIVELTPGADVSELRSALAATAPQLAPLSRRSLIAVNAEYAKEDALVNEGDDVALIPPVSGG